MKENNYNNPAFFEQYVRFPRSVQGLSAAGEWHELERLLPGFSGKRVLDLGCGFGWHCRYASDHGAAAVIGVDLSEKMLEKARADTHDESIHYVRAAMEDVDFPPASFEVDASVSPLMSEAQIYGAGMTWSWNPRRMIFIKVYDCAQVLPDGSAVPIEDDKLYRVVTGLYTGQMLGTVNDQSFGILTITPKDAQGNEVTNFEDQIIYSPNGSELKEWYALATYLQSMGTVDGRYAAPEGRKVEEASLNPVSLLKGLNLVGWIALVVCLAVLALIVFIVYRVVTRRCRRYGGQKGGGYRRYRG